MVHGSDGTVLGTPENRFSIYVLIINRINVGADGHERIIPDPEISRRDNIIPALAGQSGRSKCCSDLHRRCLRVQVIV